MMSWCWSWNSNTLATSCDELTHWKIPWCWEGLGAGGEGDDRGWDGLMASLTQWAWVWVNSGSLWWTGRPGMLRFMGSQRVRHDWATELNRTDDVIQRIWWHECCRMSCWHTQWIGDLFFFFAWIAMQGFCFLAKEQGDDVVCVVYVCVCVCVSMCLCVVCAHMHICTCVSACKGDGETQR